MADPPPGFTLDELLAYLRDGAEHDQDGFHTAREWMDMLAVSEYRMTCLLRDAQRAGILLSTRRKRMNIAGSEHSEPVYRFVFGDGS